MTTKNKQILDSDNESAKGILDDLEKITAISALNSMEGGKLLVKNLLIDVVSSVSTLCARHSDLTMQEFVALSVDMKTKINLAKVLTNAEKNKKYLNELLEQALLDE